MNDNARQALRPIVAQDQVRLGPGRGLRLAFSGMAYRMFRSSVTIAILALATAFLVHMLSYGLLQRATERQAFNELDRQRRTGQMMTRLSDTDLGSAIIDALVSGQSAPVAEYGLWSGLGASATADAVTIARRLHDTALAFGDYPAAARAVLLGEVSAQEFLLELRDAEVAHLDMQMRQLGVRAPLGSIGALRHLVVDELPRLRHFIAASQQGQRRAIDSINQSLAGQALAEALQKPAPDLIQRLRAAGYVLTSSDLVELSRLQARTSDLAKVNQALQNGEVATEIGRMASLEDAKVNFESLSAYVTQLSRAKAIRQRLIRGGMPETIAADRLLELAKTHVRESQLARALGGQTFALEATRFGLSERNQWLAVLSLLVCIVGVANAMLMSVTERFTGNRNHEMSWRDGWFRHDDIRVRGDDTGGRRGSGRAVGWSCVGRAARICRIWFPASECVWCGSPSTGGDGRFVGCQRGTGGDGGSGSGVAGSATVSDGSDACGMSQRE